MKKTKVKTVREAMTEAARMLEGASSWVIFAHSKLDGDAVGSVSALFEAGLGMGKRVRWIGADPAPANYCFLPHTEEYVIQKKYKFDSKDDLYVFLDSANESRGVEGLKDRSPDAVVINIDHHEDNTMYGTFNCVDGTASSTSEILWHIMTEAGWPITPAIAECLYTGVTADTGWFAFSNTTSAAHMMGADLIGKGANPPRIDNSVRYNRSLEGTRLWGLALLRVCQWGDASQFAMTWLTRRDFDATRALRSDTEMLIQHLMSIKGVRFAILLTEDDSGDVRGSLRSKEGIVTAAAVARAMGGGGHPRAAGIRLTGAMSDAIEAVHKAVEKAYAEWVLADR